MRRYKQDNSAMLKSLLSLRVFLVAALLTVNSSLFAEAAPVDPIKPHKPTRHLGYIAVKRPLSGNDLIDNAARGWFVRYETSGENDDIVWANGAIYEPIKPTTIS